MEFRTESSMILLRIRLVSQHPREDSRVKPVQAAIKELIDHRFDVMNEKKNGDGEATVVPSVESADPRPKTNGVHPPPVESPSASPAKRPARSDSVSDVLDTPPPKKRKASVDADAAFAARLQAEEDKLARPTRGGANRKAAPAKRKKKPKKERVTGSDDSDLDGAERKAQKPKRDTGFHVCRLQLCSGQKLTALQKPLNLSPALSNLFDGETQVSIVVSSVHADTEPAKQLSRPETTKRIWQYIKSNELQDPKDKRFIICDAKMREIFRQEKVHMFTMTKLISQQMYNPDE